MDKTPKFRIVRQTEYGPILERIKDDEDVVVDTAEPRVTEENINTGRRGFLRAGFGVTGAAAAAVVGFGSRSPEAQENVDQTGGTDVLLEMVDDQKSREFMERAPAFERETIGYKSLLELGRDEVLFVDEDNLPIGDPVPMREIVGPKYHKDGRLVAEEYRFSPGKFNEAGLLEDGIAGEWLDQVRAQRQAEYPDRKIKRCLHTVGDFAASYNNEEEPGLREAIARGDIKNYKGLIEYFANKPVVGANEHTRLDYVQEEMQFSPALPSVVEQELRRVIPGLCSQESKFNNGLTSSAGARGIFQFMPENWAHYGGQKEEISSLKKQVEIAGVFFSDLYDQIQTNIGESRMRFLEKFFADERSLQRDLIVPLMINSYNAGAARIAEAVRLYIENTPVGDMPKGKDLFIAIADFARAAKVANRGRYLNAYGNEAREYVPRVYAQAEVLGKR
jgi:hypothetical protein